MQADVASVQSLDRQQRRGSKSAISWLVPDTVKAAPAKVSASRVLPHLNHAGRLLIRRPSGLPSRPHIKAPLASSVMAAPWFEPRWPLRGNKSYSQSDS